MRYVVRVLVAVMAMVMMCCSVFATGAEGQQAGDVWIENGSYCIEATLVPEDGENPDVEYCEKAEFVLESVDEGYIQAAYNEFSGGYLAFGYVDIEAQATDFVSDGEGYGFTVYGLPEGTYIVYQKGSKGEGHVVEFYTDRVAVDGELIELVTDGNREVAELSIKVPSNSAGSTELSNAIDALIILFILLLPSLVVLIVTKDIRIHDRTGNRK